MCAKDNREVQRQRVAFADKPFSDARLGAAYQRSSMAPAQRSLLVSAIIARVPSRIGHRISRNELLGEVTAAAGIDIVHRFPELHEEAAKNARWREAVALRARLTSALFHNDPHQCREIGDRLVSSELSLQTLATMLFWPVATQLWQLSVTGNESHAQMAIATVRLARLIGRIVDDQAVSKSLAGGERRLFIARTEGTVHALGVSVVSAIFQKMGWSVEGEICLRKATDLDQVVEQSSCSMIAVSVGDLHALPTCRQAIRRVRKVFPRSPVKIAIGGPAALQNSKSFRTIAADYFAGSTFDVMRLARSGA
ncbi:MAG: cobalamin B12-binding domain-containing protein [Rhizobium sp.]|nr:cobalamin B12-binding domain-containing protein [Rhizobium sp.]